MRVHHLDCGTLCPAARRLANGEGSLFERGHLVCHCLLIEAPDGLVLVEAGIGTHDAAHRLPGMFELIAGPPYDPIATARGRVRALGFAPEDVRHIVLTHLDLDHAGGIADPTDLARLQAG
jgi:glyoxylase-like metal-dependent hydrolase (beta-lactamase superfamily II)